ncbi:hypothetical protein GCM10011375_32450 [Hymenobacter qilianensis]|uniref:Uncharacterized protein n=1 Tax=Hymenobacter qilianensis TaxID=1385715 RepID=A0ACB5PV89_9BACT|nr:hypothetical protein GCM10011375_32450 [Hymenobacter qilianensis]
MPQARVGKGNRNRSTRYISGSELGLEKTMSLKNSYNRTEWLFFTEKKPPMLCSLNPAPTFAAL